MSVEQWSALATYMVYAEVDQEDTIRISSHAGGNVAVRIMARDVVVDEVEFNPNGESS